VENFSMRTGLQIAIELRKVVNNTSHWQAQMQLTAADAFARFPDLKQFWQFMWISLSGIQKTKLGLNGPIS